MSIKITNVNNPFTQQSHFWELTHLYTRKMINVQLFIVALLIIRKIGNDLPVRLAVPPAPTSSHPLASLNLQPWKQQIVPASSIYHPHHQGQRWCQTQTWLQFVLLSFSFSSQLPVLPTYNDFRLTTIHRGSSLP